MCFQCTIIYAQNLWTYEQKNFAWFLLLNHWMLGLWCITKGMIVAFPSRLWWLQFYFIFDACKMQTKRRSWIMLAPITHSPWNITPCDIKLNDQPTRTPNLDGDWGWHEPLLCILLWSQPMLVNYWVLIWLSTYLLITY
jgi:hypothetical protein